MNSIKQNLSKDYKSLDMKDIKHLSEMVIE